MGKLPKYSSTNMMIMFNLNLSNYETNSAKDANDIAVGIGIYFNGCDDGRDCSCCGDRWYCVDDSDATEVPEVYGNCALEYGNCIIYYLDGRIERSPEK